MGSRGPLPFEPAETFLGPRPGTAFKLGPLGLGYYQDVLQTMLPHLRPQLPERWRDASTLRETRLRVDPAHGAGLSLEHSDFGFVVESVAEQPGQDVVPGEVIVSIEGRLLCGLSAPQMQASFQKRRADGARLHVAYLSEVQDLSLKDPAVVECWDAQHQCPYYFHKKTGRSSYSRAELEAPPPGSEGAAASSAASSGSSAPAAAAAAAAPAAPIDLASFLSHGFAKPKEPPKKKLKATPVSAAKAAAEKGKDESDLARDERQRWDDWNAGNRGGYTEQFLERYKNCRSDPGKPKKDKRLQGSVGPGNGMEYMARWTGSKNSFN